jgi:hypothetical protein
MAHLALPPAPPLRVALADDDNRPSFNTRQRLVWLTVATVLITAWLCTLGPLPAVLALVISKHILVAFLVMGLGVDAKRQTEL